LNQTIHFSRVADMAITLPMVAPQRIGTLCASASFVIACGADALDVTKESQPRLGTRLIVTSYRWALLIST